MTELTPEQHQRVDGLFEQALQIEPPSRQVLLDSSGAEPVVKDEVVSLLSYHRAASNKLETAIVPPDAIVKAVDKVLTCDFTHRAHDPKVIGPYQIIKKLGEGGMGSVYLAE